MNRPEYNRMRYAEKQRTAEAVKRFAELYPEKFAELKQRAAKEVNEPIKVLVRQARQATGGALSALDIDRILYPPNERHYYIRTKDQLGDEHLLFESLQGPQYSLAVAQKHWPTLATALVSVEPCHCPACLKRHGN